MKPAPPTIREATRLIRSGPKTSGPDAVPLAQTVGPPVQRGSTVLLPDAAALYDHGQVTYGRAGLAAQNALIGALCELEGAVGAQLFPSGLAAMTGAILAVVEAGDTVLVADSIYAPTRRFCDKVLKRMGVRVEYYPPRATPETLIAQGGEDLALIVLESPGSLTFEMQDAPAITAAARARGVLTLIDNTWAAGLLYKPLAHGVDFSVQALTKYVCGHSDVFMGSACAGTPAGAQALDEAVLHVGWAVSPDDAYQALRGLRTLPTRMARHGQSGLKIAAWLAEQPQVSLLLHPALPASPDHALWRRDFSGACGLFGVVLQPAPASAVDAFLDALSLFGLGFSWGGFESLAISCDAQLGSRQHHQPYPGPLVRLHVGLEDPQDLIEDLQQALTVFESRR
ncbi:MAG: cystathionine beta-lyase [Caulobacteraceae bacterium]|nr:cystathionine beta-lyase [Caulobacteraceae bacterium]